MDNLLISTSSLEKVRNYINSPGLPLVLTGDQWLDKLRVARYISAAILELSPYRLINYPHYIEIDSIDNRKIGIEEIRRISAILNLTVPSNKSISRIIVINNAQDMTLEAQNALLKNLEEPPEATLFILCSTSINALLPTIASRVSKLALTAPNKEQLVSYFKSQGHKESEIDGAFSMSGGQPMLMELLLASDDHPLSIATKLAKEMLSGTKIDRFNLVNDLAKDKTQLSYFFFIIKEMAKIGLKSSNNASSKRWKIILKASLESETMLKASVQSKLTLTNFILSIS